MVRHRPVAANHEGEIEVVVLIKAAPEMGQKHGETVCVAGVDAYGGWHRLYPVPYRDLKSSQRFSRWDRIRVRWRRPKDDQRSESKRIDPDSLTVVSSVRSPEERAEVAQRAIVTSLEDEMKAGRSLALIRPQNPKFIVRRLSEAQLQKSRRRRAQLTDQGDLLAVSLISREPPPFSFSYRFDHGGRTREHLCIDWETEQTFFNWRRQYGEERTITEMKETFGERIPSKGLVFAMGTHRVRMFRKWLLSGVIQAAEPTQGSFL